MRFLPKENNQIEVKLNKKFVILIIVIGLMFIGFDHLLNVLFGG